MTLIELKTEISSILGVEQSALDFNSNPSSLPEWDSIAELGIISFLDRVTNGTMEPEDAAKVSSFGAIVEIVRSRGILEN